MWRLNTVLRRVNSIACPRSRPIWFAVRWRCIFMSSSAAALAAKQATATIPIVFSLGEDPLKLGLVASLNRPGGRMTGSYNSPRGSKRSDLGCCTNGSEVHDGGRARRSRTLRLPKPSCAMCGRRRTGWVSNRCSARQCRRRFQRRVRDSRQQRAGALLVCGSPFFNGRREQLVVLAARHAVPAIYEWRDFAAAGGLMSYGTNLADFYRQGGVYAGRDSQRRETGRCRSCSGPSSSS